MSEQSHQDMSTENNNPHFAELSALAKKAIANAYAPYSGYRVGVALRTVGGQIVTGCNIEFADYLGLEAIECAVARLVSGQDWKADKDAVTVRDVVFAVSYLDFETLVHYPSPRSLGRLRFFADQHTRLSFIDHNNMHDTALLSELLPKSPNLHQSMLSFRNQPPIGISGGAQDYDDAEENRLPEKLYKQLFQARGRSVSPSSGYAVAALIESEKGHFYAGSNIETALHNAIHAEESAISGMIAREGSEASINKIFVMGSGGPDSWPCGNCRQKIREFSKAETVVYSVDEQGYVHSKTVEDLLPDAFSKDHINK